MNYYYSNLIVFYTYCVIHDVLYYSILILISCAGCSTRLILVYAFIFILYKNIHTYISVHTRCITMYIQLNVNLAANDYSLSMPMTMPMSHI